MTNTRDTIRAKLWPVLAETDRPLSTVDLVALVALGVPNATVHVWQVMCEQERAGRVHRLGYGDPPACGGHPPVRWALTPRGLLLGLWPSAGRAEPRLRFCPAGAEGGAS